MGSDLCDLAVDLAREMVEHRQPTDGAPHRLGVASVAPAIRDQLGSFPNEVETSGPRDVRRAVEMLFPERSSSCSSSAQEVTDSCTGTSSQERTYASSDRSTERVTDSCTDQTTDTRRDARTTRS